jgi:aminoglycoside phosphotransferase (APT) family kinase protein
MRMHADQVELTEDAVVALVRAQLPAWAGSPVRRVLSDGTVNALFRVGDEVVLRFPLRPDASDAARASVLREQDTARQFGAVVPVAIPEPLAVGAPADAYRGWWSAYGWTPGEPPEPPSESESLAVDLAAVVGAIRRLDTGGRAWDGRSRGGPLATRDGAVRAALAASGGLTDTRAVEAAWTSCLGATPCAADTWLHADLMPGNLLLRDGRLAAVIDLESACVGDPAVDLMPAWNLFGPRARAVFREATGAEDATWERGRGWAIVQAIVALPYYVDTNPAMAETARRTLAAVAA